MRSMRGVHRMTSAGDLEARVAQLREILLPPSTPYPTREREALRAAKSATDAAQARLNEAAANAGNVAKLLERGHGLPPELREARAAFEDAQRREGEAKAALVKAKERREREFATAVGAQLAEAGPVLTELVRLLDAGFSPLIALYGYAVTNNLPTTRGLQAAAELQTALRRATMVVNAIAPPDRGEDE